jgi:hypothetical protein
MKPQTAREFFSEDLGLTACAFCEQPRALQLSHVLPSFVIRWLRETAATGHIRVSHEPNRRIQDGWKARMLCAECEQLFSRWERAFAEGAFYPIHNSNAPAVSYGPWLAKFAAAQSWRTLRAYQLRDALDDYLPPRLLTQVPKALDRWKAFLLDQHPHPAKFELHVLRLDIIQSTDIPDLPPMMNRYLYRAVDQDVPTSQTSAFVYSKLCRIVILGFIEMPGPRVWKNTRISPSHGSFGTGDTTVPAGFLNFMAEKARELMVTGEQLSPRQMEKISHEVQQNPKRAAESEIFHAMKRDSEMFGRTAFGRRLEDE